MIVVNLSAVDSDQLSAAGAIMVKLVSQDFEADTLHGEDSQLCKEENDFHGLEFEKQFACVYKVRSMLSALQLCNVTVCLYYVYDAGGASEEGCFW